MTLARGLHLCVLFCVLALAPWRHGHASPAEALPSVVSVLPVWPGRAQGGQGGPPGVAPEGSGIIVQQGIVATAWHVIEPARRIDVRLHDGRILPAELIGHDTATDIALLRVDTNISALDAASATTIAHPVCAIGNAFGLGLSVTCGVVSATRVTNAGFNPVEDFVQTDAALNPGSSGGALVDAQGQLVGMVSAIFASEGNTNTGVGFAVSTELLLRVADQLLADGDVRFASAGWQLSPGARAQVARIAAPVVRSINVGGPAARAGIQPGDLVVEVGGRRVTTPRDAVTALAVLRPDVERVTVVLERNGTRVDTSLDLITDPTRSVGQAGPMLGDCPHPEAVCRVRQSVFPISSFDPVGSATRIGPNLLVTNRHVVGDRRDAVVHTPSGPRGAQVVPSSYTGDLVLLEVAGLPENGHTPDLNGSAPTSGMFFTVGADVARQEIRIFAPGDVIARPAPDANLGRIHVTSPMQPGVSGGALVGAEGDLVGIAVGGGEGRFEAIPISNVQALLQGRHDDTAGPITERLGQAFAECAASIDAAKEGDPEALEALIEPCTVGMNHGQLLEAGRLLARAGDFDAAAQLHGQAVRQVPNSINTRMSLLVSLQLGARFDDMTEHARILMDLAPDEPGALRFAIQSGVWGGVPELAERAYQLLLEADPRQAQAARRFIDSAPPAPLRRQ